MELGHGAGTWSEDMELGHTASPPCGKRGALAPRHRPVGSVPGAGRGSEGSGEFSAINKPWVATESAFPANKSSPHQKEATNHRTSLPLPAMGTRLAPAGSVGRARGGRGAGAVPPAAVSISPPLPVSRGPELTTGWSGSGTSRPGRRDGHRHPRRGASPRSHAPEATAANPSSCCDRSCGWHRDPSFFI